jgi:hypothetical protein
MHQCGIVLIENEKTPFPSVKAESSSRRPDPQPSPEILFQSKNLIAGQTQKIIGIIPKMGKLKRFPVEQIKSPTVRADPQFSPGILQQGIYYRSAYALGGSGLRAENGRGPAVVAVQSAERSEPHIAVSILGYAVNRIIGKPILHGQMGEAVFLGGKKKKTEKKQEEANLFRPHTYYIITRTRTF